mgnify:FL=1
MSVPNPNFAQVLLKIYEAEHLLWKILADLGEWSFSDLQGNPIKGISVKALEQFFKENEWLAVGVIPFYVKKFLPLTPEAYNSGCHTLAEALLWAEKQNILPEGGENSALHAFSRAYFMEAGKLAGISSVGVRVCFGIDHATARLMFLPDFDRWSVEMFLRHFKLSFSIIGSEETLRDDFRDPVQMALVDLLLASPKQRHVQRIKFLRTAFKCSPFPTGTHQSQDVATLKEHEHQVLTWCAAIGVALPTARRFLQLYGLEEKEAYNVARRTLRRVQPRSSPKHLPRSKNGELLLQICRCLLNRALDGPYTTTMLIEAFMWASLASVQIVRLGSIRGFEGYWITWIEKRMQGYLRMLAALPDNLCGADEFCSAKNNVLGEHDDAA